MIIYIFLATLEKNNISCNDAHTKLLSFLRSENWENWEAPYALFLKESVYDVVMANAIF